MIDKTRRDEIRAGCEYILARRVDAGVSIAGPDGKEVLNIPFSELLALLDGCERLAIQAALTTRAGDGFIILQRALEVPDGE